MCSDVDREYQAEAEVEAETEADMEVEARDGDDKVRQTLLYMRVREHG